MSERGTESVWLSGLALPRFPTLDALGALDALIIGGGISGLTTGLLLQRAGYRTALLEQHRVGSGETARTSAHLTEFLDAWHTTLVADFGREGARLVAQSTREALGQIEMLAREIPCEFERVSGYLFTERVDELDRLREEMQAAQDAGVAAHAIAAAPLPFKTAGAIEFPNQAQFHPLKYLGGLIRLYAEAGGTISELTHVGAIDETTDGCRVQTERTTLHSKYVVAMTDAPITGGTLLDTKLRANRSYVIAAHVDEAAVPSGLFWDTDDPYHFIRAARIDGRTLVLIGGEDHRVGTDRELDAFERLERYANERFAGTTIAGRWSGQIMDPIDGLPYIGPREENSRVHLATGYAGNGLTFGTLAAQLIVDAISGRVNPYATLYSPNRLLGAKQWAKYAAQNLPAAWTLVTDMLPLPRAASVDDLQPGQGRVMRIGGEKVAAARDEAGMIHIVSATCTHMGCDVAWNNVEQTWGLPVSWVSVRCGRPGGPRSGHLAAR